jgi:acetolactate decarboxylase
MIGQARPVLAALLCLLYGVGLAVQPEPKKGYEVRWEGEMRQVMMQGDLSGRVDLQKLAGQPHLYALGPLEGLRGEVSIFDGTPSISRIEKGRLVVEQSFASRACFLVYAQVGEWREVPIPASVKSDRDLEKFVFQAANEKRLDVHRPFLFRVKGRPDVVRLHVVNRTDDRPFSREEHEKIKVPFSLKKQPVEVIGFYSESHHGVFTHHDSNVHMHVKTQDGKTAGHVDQLEMSGGLLLYLP